MKKLTWCEVTGTRVFIVLILWLIVSSIVAVFWNPFGENSASHRMTDERFAQLDRENYAHEQQIAQFAFENGFVPSGFTRRDHGFCFAPIVLSTTTHQPERRGLACSQDFSKFAVVRGGKIYLTKTGRRIK